MTDIKTKRFQVTVPAPIADQLKLLSDTFGVSMSGMFAMAVGEFVFRHEYNKVRRAQSQEVLERLKEVVAKRKPSDSPLVLPENFNEDMLTQDEMAELAEGILRNLDESQAK